MCDTETYVCDRLKVDVVIFSLLWYLEIDDSLLKKGIALEKVNFLEKTFR